MGTVHLKEQLICAETFSTTDPTNGGK